MKKIKKIFIIFGIFSLITGLVPKNLKASTNISGSIVNSVWDEAGSPYIIDGTFTVQEGAELTIQAGAIIQFNEDAKLVINGILNAQGEENNKIIFSSSQSSPTRGDWAGIEFGDSSSDAEFDENGDYVSGSIIKNATIKYAEAIDCYNSNPYFEDVLFLNNGTALSLTGEEENLDEVYSIIRGNDFQDNEVGININYELEDTEDDDDDDQYGSGPGGSSNSDYSDVVPMAVIKDNYFINNNQAIVASSSKNVFIKENTITSSNQEAIYLGTNTTGNIIEQNIVNNNVIGIKVASSDSKITQNTINNNSQYGLQMLVTDTYIKNNNIYGNEEYNLYGQVATIDASENYWGVNDADDAYETMNVSGVDYTPIITSKISIDSMVTTVVETAVTQTNSVLQDLIGVKPSDTAIYINDEVIKERGYETDWQYYVDLEVGDNVFTVYYMDIAGNQSPSTTLTINREEIIILTDPEIEYEEETTETSVALKGTKDAGTGIWINGELEISPDQSANWLYQAELDMGVNEFAIFSEDEEGRTSNQVKIYITRNDVDPSEIIQREKELVTEVDEALTEKLKGMILLQVESEGEAWYVNPDDGLKYYLGRQSDAFSIMSNFGLGIAHDTLEIYLADVFPDRLAGKIMLDVENSGEAYYIYPKDLKGYFLGKPADAFDIMRDLSLGITNENLRKIQVGEIN